MSGRDRILISPQHSSRSARPDGRYDMRSSRVITDDRLSQKRGIFADEIYSTMCRMGR